MIGKPHTVPQKSTGKSGSVAIRLVPAPKVPLPPLPSPQPLFLFNPPSLSFQGAGLVAGATSKKVLAYAGIQVLVPASPRLPLSFQPLAILATHAP